MIKNIPTLLIELLVITILYIILGFEVAVMASLAKILYEINNLKELN